MEGQEQMNGNEEYCMDENYEMIQQQEGEVIYCRSEEGQAVENQQYYQAEAEAVNEEYSQQASIYPNQQPPRYMQPAAILINHVHQPRLQPHQILQPNPVDQPYYPVQQPVLTPPPQPYYPQQPVLTPGQILWSTHLFDCFDDISLCCVTNWCPCVVFGWISEIVDKGSSTSTTSAKKYALAMLAPGIQFMYSGSYRTKLRVEYGIAGDSLEDVCAHFWCEGCALYQEYKELTLRGYDVPLGWHGNMAKQRQTQGVQMAPAAPNGMTR